MNFITVGTILDSHGLNGEVKVFSQTHFSKDRYKIGNKLFLEKGEDIKEVTVASYKSSGQIDFVSFKEFKSLEEAKAIKGYKICLKREDITLKEGQYLFSDLINLKIITEKGDELGEVIKVEEFPAQITLRCKAKNNKNFFIPFIKEFIREVDLTKKTITINYMEGIL